MTNTLSDCANHRAAVCAAVVENRELNNRHREIDLCVWLRRGQDGKH